MTVTYHIALLIAVSLVSLHFRQLSCFCGLIVRNGLHMFIKLTPDFKIICNLKYIAYKVIEIWFHIKT